MNWIDTHAHLNTSPLYEQVDAVVARAKAQGVGKILVIGIDAPTSQRAVQLAERFDELFAVVGIQPNSLLEAGPTDWDTIVALASSKKVVALGETGLDHYWKTVPFALQQEYFDRHLELSFRLDLPFVVHCRQAEAEVVEQLTRARQRRQAPLAGVMHSFTGDLATAQACVELGLHLSFAGMVTYKKNDALRDVARWTPGARLLLETDSPYLAPQPFRGQTNEPANVAVTGKLLAEALQRDVADLAQQTTANAERLFRLG